MKIIIALVIAITASSAAMAQQSSSVYGPNGNYQGSVRTHGNTSSFTNNQFTGREDVAS